MWLPLDTRWTSRFKQFYGSPGMRFVIGHAVPAGRGSASSGFAMSVIAGAQMGPLCTPREASVDFA
jgi:hypothetical protein